MQKYHVIGAQDRVGRKQGAVVLPFCGQKLQDVSVQSLSRVVKQSLPGQPWERVCDKCLERLKALQDAYQLPAIKFLAPKTATNSHAVNAASAA